MYGTGRNLKTVRVLSLIVGQSVLNVVVDVPGVLQSQGKIYGIVVHMGVNMRMKKKT